MREGPWVEQVLLTVRTLSERVTWQLGEIILRSSVLYGLGGSQGQTIVYSPSRIFLVDDCEVAASVLYDQILHARKLPQLVAFV